jgi:hypothetical protein
MKEIIEKLSKIEKETSLEKGEYGLFALFLREDSNNKWDIVVAASWIDENKGEALKYLAHKIQQSLTQREILQISHISIIENNHHALISLQKAIHVEHGIFEIKDSIIFDVHIKHAFLITSKMVSQEV